VTLGRVPQAGFNPQTAERVSRVVRKGFASDFEGRPDMANGADGPRVFVSSTVRDLGDLRSAVKFWLEESGYTVYTSEATDFPAPADRRAPEAAMSVIADCEYFVLIVGWRRGAPLDGSGVSVTRAEFRHARELARTVGRPRLLSFVRRDVEIAERTAGSPTESDDWKHQLEFLAELRGSRDATDPNWLHSFASFREVTEILRATLRIRGPLRRRAVEANLRQELLTNSRALLHRVGSGYGPIADLALLHDWAGVPRERETVSESNARALARYMLIKPGTGTLRRSALRDAIASGEFLVFRPQSGAMEVGPVQSALLELEDQTGRYEAVSSLVSQMASDVYQVFPNVRGQARGPVELSADAGDWFYATAASLANILTLTRALYRWLLESDQPYESPILRRAVANMEDAAQIDRESLIESESHTWLLSSRWPERET
jgi:hypothetical protein